MKKKYIGSLPQEAKQLSDELNIPIIRLPEEIPFAALFAPLMDAISRNRDMEMRDNHLLMDIISGNNQMVEGLDTRAYNQRWPALPARIALIEVHGNRAEFLDGSFLQERLVSVIGHSFRERLVGAHVIANGNMFVIIFPDKFTKDYLTTAFDDVISNIKKNADYMVQVGISDCVHSYQELKDAHTDALAALQLGTALHVNSSTLFIREFRLEQALQSLSTNVHVREYFDDTIGKITDYDKANNAELLRTLEILIRCMGVKSKAASELFLHRNTLLYRVRKIEALTGMDLSDGDNLSRLAIVLKMRSFL